METATVTNALPVACESDRRAQPVRLPLPRGRKAQAVIRLLQSPEARGLIDREIDRLCGVSPGYTSRLRKLLTGAAPHPAKSATAKKSNVTRWEKPTAGDTAPDAATTAALDPVSRALVEMIRGLNGRPLLGLEDAARRLGLARERAAKLLADAVAAMQSSAGAG